MSIADKLVYLNDTKQQLLTALNDAGAAISESDPFRSYVNWVEFLGWELAGGLDSLFDSGESGSLWDVLPYYSDTAGTEEATWGDPVGLIQDASGNGNDFTQPTVTARPVLGRVPEGGRRNMALVSEGEGIWTLNAGAVATHDGENPYGDLPAARVTTSSSSVNSGVYRANILNQDIAAGFEITASVRIKPLAMNGPIRLRLEGSAFPVVAGALYDFSSGTVTAIGSAIGAAVREEESGFYIVEVIALSQETGNVNLVLYNSTAVQNEFIVSARQLEAGSAGTPYQAVYNSFNITEASVPSIHYLHFDGTDDLVSTTLPAISNGTVVIAGTEGIWIDEDFNFGGGTFEIGPTSYTNGPAGILPVIGDLIVGGTFVIDRQLTSDERAKVVRKMRSMGSPGLFQLGPELVINGDFSDGLNGWTISITTNPDDCQVIDNQLVVIGPTASSFNLINNMVNAPPGQYIIAGERIASEYSGAARLLPSSSDASLALSLNTQGAFLSRVVDIENSARLVFQVTSSGMAGGTFDNFSMRKLELIP